MAPPKPIPILYWSIAIVGVVTAYSGTITTWRGDATGHDCSGHQACDQGGGKLCAAPMRQCQCQGGRPKAAKLTNDAHLFKQWCRRGSMDGKTITVADRNRCLSCELPTCDSSSYPSCRSELQCGRAICVQANGRKIQTFEMDSCPSAHQKNVAKCCMWGHLDPSYCACIKGDNTWLDVNGLAMDRLGCPNLCRGAAWWYGNCTGSATGGRGACTDVPTPDGFTCQQQKAWGKCNQSWMGNYCKRTCGKC